MPHEFEGERSRRRYERATGPFDGLLDKPVLVYDLNPGGCFINSPLEQPEGSILILKIDLIQEGRITVNAQAMYRHKLGFAVCFVDVDADTSARLVRTVDAWKARRATQW
jgi:hypothetical protein